MAWDSDIESHTAALVEHVSGPCWLDAGCAGCQGLHPGSLAALCFVTLTTLEELKQMTRSHHVVSKHVQAHKIP